MSIGVAVRRGAVVVSFLGLACLAGCGEGSNNPKTAKVTGKVTLDGQPLEGAIVMFAPEGGAGNAASGTTDASGTYSLTTFVRDDGAVPGSYQVSVTKAPEGSGGAAAGVTDEDAAYKAAEAAGEDLSGTKGAPSGEVKSPVPIKYTNPGTSGLTAKVADGQDNVVDLALTSE